MSTSLKKNYFFKPISNIKSNQENISHTTQDSSSKSKQNIDEIKKVRVVQKSNGSTSKGTGKLDQFLNVSKNKQPKKVEQKKIVNQCQLMDIIYENSILTSKLEQFDKKEQQFVERSKVLLKNLIVQNIKLKQQQRKYMLSYQIQSQYEELETKKRQYLKLTQELQSNKFNTPIQKLFKLNQEKILKNQISIEEVIIEKNKKSKKLAFFQSNCFFNFSSQKWPLLNNRFQAYELFYQSQDAQYYKALDLNTLENVAVKIYRLKNSDQQNNPEREQIQNEYNLQSQLNHKNILKVLDKFELSKDRICIIFQWSQHSLDELKNLKQSQMIEILKMIGDGISYLHQKNIVHMNIKMNNILFINGVAKITDFKFAANVNQNTINRIKLKNGQKYMAPQFINQIIPKIPTTKFDIWCYGTLISQMNENMQAKQRQGSLKDITINSIKHIKLRQFINNTLVEVAFRESIQKLLNILNTN